MKMMLSISDFVFSVYSDTDYHQFTRTAESGLAAVDRGGQAPATQRTGQPLQMISLAGQVLGKGSGEVLDQLRAFINAGPQLVMRGNGQSLGQWNVTRVTETGTRLIDDGTALKTTFTVDLQEYKG